MQLVFMGAQHHGRHLELAQIPGIGLAQTRDVFVPAAGIFTRGRVESLP